MLTLRLVDRAGFKFQGGSLKCRAVTAVTGNACRSGVEEKRDEEEDRQRNREMATFPAGPQNKTLHVAGISPVVDEPLLAEIFGAFGAITSCRIIRDAAGVHGYCDFADYNSAR